MDIKIIIPYFSHFEVSDFFEKLPKEIVRINYENIYGHFSVKFTDKLDKTNLKELIDLNDAGDSIIWYKSELRKYKYIELNIVLEFEDDSHCNKDKMEKLLCEGVILYKNTFTYDEVFLANCSKDIFYYFFLCWSFFDIPHIRLLKSYLLINEKYYTSIEPLNIISLRSFENKCIFKYKEIEFSLVWQSLFYEFYFKNQKSINNIGRAIAILSKLQMNKNDENLSNLMYVMMALEALYARGQQSISSQLVEKIHLFLGEDFIQKKKINSLYSIRSRYIHGDVELSLEFSEIEDTFEDTSKIDDAFYYSYYIMINTLIKIIKEDLCEFEFDYSLRQNYDS